MDGISAPYGFQARHLPPSWYQVLGYRTAKFAVFLAQLLVVAAVVLFLVGLVDYAHYTKGHTDIYRLTYSLCLFGLFAFAIVLTRGAWFFNESVNLWWKRVTTEVYLVPKDAVIDITNLTRDRMSSETYPLSPGALRLGQLLNDVILKDPEKWLVVREPVERHYRMLCLQDRSTFNSPLPDDAPAGMAAVWFNNFRTYMFHLGNCQGTSMMTHMLMGEKTLVLTVPKMSNFVSNPPPVVPGIELEMGVLTGEAHKAKVVTTISDFETELLTRKYEQVIVYGTDMFQAFTSEYWDLMVLIDHCSARGVMDTDLPRLFILN